MTAIAITVFFLSLLLLPVSLAAVLYYWDFCRDTFEESRRQYNIRRDFVNDTYENQRNLDPEVHPCRIHWWGDEKIHYLYIRIPREIFKTGEGEL